MANETSSFSRGLMSRPRWFSLGVFTCGLLVFGYRGWDGRRSLMALDVVFVQQSLDPSNPFSGINTPLGQFYVLRQFSGYLHTVARVLVELFGLAPLTTFPILTYVTSTLIWAGCGWALFLCVRPLAGALAGSVSAVSFTLLPPSNIILLAQLNALQWPMLVACIVLVATNFEPRSRPGRAAYLTLLFFTAASAALGFIPLLMLSWRWLLHRRRNFTLWLGVSMAIPYSAQVFAYLRQPGRRAEDLNPISQLVREAAYIPKVLLAGPLRGEVSDSLSFGATALLVVILVGLLSIVVGAILLLKDSDRRRSLTIAELIIVGSLSGVISVVLNGNLNHQYLMIPLTTLWTAVILSVHRLLGDPTRRHLGQLGTLFAVAVFVFSGIGTWKPALHDPFFVAPRPASLDESLGRAKAQCAISPEAIVDASGTGLALPCNIVITLR